MLHTRRGSISSSEVREILHYWRLRRMSCLVHGILIFIEHGHVTSEAEIVLVEGSKIDIFHM